MTKPPAPVREGTFRRDGYRCVACGAPAPLEWQHRQASGHGGRGPKAPPLTPADGVTACTFCNNRFEHDMQELALHTGWKVRRHILMTCDQVPFYDRNLGVWMLPDVHGNAVVITETAAVALIEVAGGYTKKGGLP